MKSIIYFPVLFLMVSVMGCVPNLNKRELPSSAEINSQEYVEYKKSFIDYDKSLSERKLVVIRKTFHNRYPDSKYLSYNEKAFYKKVKFLSCNNALLHYTIKMSNTDYGGDVFLRPRLAPASNSSDTIYTALVFKNEPLYVPLLDQLDSGFISVRENYERAKNNPGKHDIQPVIEGFEGSHFVTTFYKWMPDITRNFVEKYHWQSNAMLAYDCPETRRTYASGCLDELSSAFFIDKVPTSRIEFFDGKNRLQGYTASIPQGYILARDVDLKVNAGDFMEYKELAQCVTDETPRLDEIPSVLVLGITEKMKLSDLKGSSTSSTDGDIMCLFGQWFEVSGGLIESSMNALKGSAKGTAKGMYKANRAASKDKCK